MPSNSLLNHRLHDLQLLSRLHPVSKVLQHHTWDCGLACVLMILRPLGHPTLTIPQLTQQAQTQSIWTIDLACLLLHYLPRHRFIFYTSFAGINPLEDNQKDVERVRGLFETNRQWVREVNVGLRELKQAVSGMEAVVILLVDGRRLECLCCGRHHQRSWSSWMAAHLRGTKCSGFVGHYILLLAYIPSLDVFLYRDPGLPEEFCLASAPTIEVARSRPGTDTDCIVFKL